jgi:hypothetical protein
MRLTTTIASAAVAGLLGLAGVSVAGAAATGSAGPMPAAAPTTTTVTPTPTTPKAADSARHGKRAALRRRLRRRAGVIAAHSIGIEPRALLQELRSGKTIAEVATEHGVQPRAVIDAIEAAATARVDKAQANNRITAEQAARLKQRIAVLVPRMVDQWHPRPRPAG